MRKTFILSIAALSFSIIATPASACGLLGCIANAIVPGAGDKLDEAHDRLKKAIPPYGQAEEAASGGVRHLSGEIVGETAGPALAQWIWASKSDVWNAGVRPIPMNIRMQLAPYFPADVLAGVYYRVGVGNELALPANAFRSEAVAITLDNLIMFRDGAAAAWDAKLWAHELTHVLQYRRWGVLDFAKRYVKDHDGVEREAEDNANRIFAMMAQRAGPAPMGGVFQPAGGMQMGNFCLTPIGRFGPGPMNPLRAPCNVMTPQGPVFGQVGF